MLLKRVPEMIKDDKLRQIAKDLLAKSKTEKVKWEKVQPQEMGLEPWSDAQAFKVSLPQSSIVLRYVSPQSEPDYFLLSLRNSQGETVVKWTVEEGAEDWQLVGDLYSEANRLVTGWDKVLADVEKYLHGLDKVGS
jgi:hypothetical protein